MVDVESKDGPFKKFKKLFLTLVLFTLGLLLTLAGFSLIEFSLELLKYSGIGLLALGIIYYFVY